MVDPITAAGQKARVNDGLPETLEEVVARYGQRWFKLKVGGDAKADVERLSEIATVLDQIAQPYHASLDGNEQYDDFEGVAVLWSAMKREARLKRLVDSIIFFEQPVKRQKALATKVSGIAKRRAVAPGRSEATRRRAGTGAAKQMDGTGRFRPCRSRFSHLPRHDPVAVFAWHPDRR